MAAGGGTFSSEKSLGLKTNGPKLVCSGADGPATEGSDANGPKLAGWGADGPGREVAETDGPGGEGAGTDGPPETEGDDTNMSSSAWAVTNSGVPFRSQGRRFERGPARNSARLVE